MQHAYFSHAMGLAKKYLYGISMKGPMSGMPGCAAAVAFLKLLGITFDESSVLAKLKVDDIVELCQSS